MNTTTCQNCGNSFTGNYCNNCGQKIFAENDRSFKKLGDEIFHFLTHFEGSFWVTLKTVLFRPGKLSVDYCNGIRKKYYKPISLFLLLILLYLLFPLLQGLNMKMELYQHLPYFGDYIENQIHQKAVGNSMSIAELSAAFERKSEKTAKILLLILIPLSAGALALLRFKKRRPSYDLFILATEINIFMLFFFFIFQPVILAVIFWIWPDRDIGDKFLTVIFSVIFVAFLTVAFRRFFQVRWLRSFLSSLLFVFQYIIITMIIYKILLFEVTFLFV